MLSNSSNDKYDRDKQYFMEMNWTDLLILSDISVYRENSRYLTTEIFSIWVSQKSKMIVQSALVPGARLHRQAVFVAERYYKRREQQCVNSEHVHFPQKTNRGLGQLGIWTVRTGFGLSIFWGMHVSKRGQKREGRLLERTNNVRGLYR